MGVLTENPFLTAKKILKSLKEKEVDIVIVDFHAEATAEKIAMGYYLDGEITALYGTHTHVQTADEKVLKKRYRIYYRYRNDRTKRERNRNEYRSITKKICYNTSRKV